jgi:hypothetical protein
VTIVLIVFVASSLSGSNAFFLCRVPVESQDAVAVHHSASCLSRE